MMAETDLLLLATLKKQPFADDLQSRCSFDKVPNLRPANLFKKRLRHGYFSVNFAEIFKSTFFIEHLTESSKQIIET